MIAYEGRKAARYEAKRAHTRKWALEHAAVSELLDITSPRSVIDIPVGTGRFAGLYQGMRVIGMDLSQDMLNIASRRMPGRYLIHDIRQPFPVQAEMGVCIRMSGWLSPGDLRSAITHLGDACDRFIIGLRTGEPRQKGLFWIHEPAILDDLNIIDRRWVKPDSYGIYLCK